MGALIRGGGYSILLFARGAYSGRAVIRYWAVIRSFTVYIASGKSSNAEFQPSCNHTGYQDLNIYASDLNNFA